MSTRQMRDKKGKWHDINDARTPEGFGTPGQVMAVDSKGTGMTWATPAAGSIVDDKLDENSENPVMNKVLTPEIQAKYDIRRNFLEQFTADVSGDFIPLDKDGPLITGLKVYAFTELGQKILIGSVSGDQDDVIHRGGGTLFYINEEAKDFTYTFFDETGKVIPEPKIGDKIFAYKTDRHASYSLPPRYYIWHDEFKVDKPETTGKNYWAPYDAGGQTIEENLGTKTSFGEGYNNWLLVKEAHDGLYMKKEETIWYTANVVNYDNNSLCHDWFIPSMDEMKALLAAKREDGTLVLNPEVDDQCWAGLATSSESGSYDYHCFEYRPWKEDPYYWGRNAKKQDRVPFVLIRAI